MISQAARDYINRARNAGYSDPQVSDALKSNGWRDEDIREALASVPFGSSETDAKASNLAIAALIFSFIFPIIGLILGIMVIKKSNKSEKRIAIASIAISILFLAAAFLVVPLVIAYLGALPSRLLPDKCLFPAGIECIDKVILTPDNVELAMRNNLRFPIIIEEIRAFGCTGESMVKTNDLYELARGKNVESNQVFLVNINGCSNGESGKRFENIINISYTINGQPNKVNGLVRGKVS